VGTGPPGGGDKPGVGLGLGKLGDLLLAAGEPPQPAPISEPAIKTTETAVRPASQIRAICTGATIGVTLGHRMVAERPRGRLSRCPDSQARPGRFVTRPMIWAAALKLLASRFFVMANAIPVAASPKAKLPPTPPTPNAVCVS